MSSHFLDKRFKIISHTIFWLVSIVVWLFIFFYYEEEIHFDLVIFSKALITNTGFALSIYINLYLLIPKFLKEKNYIFYIFWLLVLLTVSSLLIQFFLMLPLNGIIELGKSFTSFDINLHSAYFFVSMVYVGITTFLKFIKDWLSLQDVNLKLAKIEQQKLEAELKTLKSQLNPHFLFNSLNNIYSLALMESEKVPGLILQLSDLMRHIIYESKENYISLEKEIEFVNNFITLQRIRVPDHVEIKYEITGPVPEGKIAPLLFEPFIDNAFKHGLPGNGDNDFIHITFNFNKPGFLQFTIENNYEEKTHWNKKDSGIGISNVKQRLKLLYNPDDYKFSTMKSTHVFSVSLQLKLLKHGN